VLVRDGLNSIPIGTPPRIETDLSRLRSPGESGRVLGTHRALLPTAEHIVTTEEGAHRLGSNTIGLASWQQTELRTPNGDPVTVTATPARHGPADADRGPVIGFALASSAEPEHVLYLSGDTVWYDARAVVHLLRPGAGAADSAPHESAPHLTPRQLDVLRLLAEGRPAKEIAGQLWPSETTVRNHIRAVLRALESHSQLEALSKARRLGLVA
jgi:DNA-binding CsgD family transcriptional regulator